MKKIFRLLVAVALVMMASGAKAQFRIDLMAGGASPLGEQFDKVAKFGLGYSIDFMYVPDILDNQLSFGVAKDGNVLLSANASWNNKSVDLKASMLGLYGAKARFDLETNSTAKPYAAITLGCGHLKCAYVKAEYDGYDEETGVDADAEAAYDYSNAFAVKPEIGLALGCFQFGIGWILPTTYGDREIKAGAVQYNIGFRIKID